MTLLDLTRTLTARIRTTVPLDDNTPAPRTYDRDVVERPAAEPDTPPRAEADSIIPIARTAGSDMVPAIPPLAQSPERTHEINELNELRGGGAVQAVGAQTLNSFNSYLQPVIVRVNDADGLAAAAAAVRTAKAVGLDVETSGLNPTTDRVRLLQVGTQETVYIVDVFALCDPAAELADLFSALTAVEVLGHNLQYELRFLARLGFVPGRVFDTMIASQLLHAGRTGSNNARLTHTLAAVVERELGIILDKSLQNSDWSGNLTDDQIRYAAIDAAVLHSLVAVLRQRLDVAKLTETAVLEMRSLPGIAWSRGFAFDVEGWTLQASAAAEDRTRLDAELRTLDRTKQVTNWNSNPQALAALRAAGANVDSTAEDVLAGIDLPIAAKLREYRTASKRVGTYGPKWCTEHVRADGRVTPSWHQIGAATGRMSCSKPNLQQIPKDPTCRRCFIAPAGRMLVKADYSQIELRIVARIAAEQRMLAAYQSGEDLHILTAAAVLGKPASAVTKDDRQLAKAVNFGLLYGMGAGTLRLYARKNYGINFSDSEAARCRSTFFRTYPGLSRWHAAAGGAPGLIETRTLGGRRRIGVERFTEKLNTPVQGTGADGLKAAIALLWERRAECPSAVPVLYCHDEIVIECDVAESDRVSTWLRKAMIDGMAPLIDPVPVAIEVTVCQTSSGIA